MVFALFAKEKIVEGSFTWATRGPEVELEVKIAFCATPSVPNQGSVDQGKSLG